MAWWNRTAGQPPVDEEEFRLERLERRVDLLAGDTLQIFHVCKRILAMSQAVLDKIAELQSRVESEHSVELSAITLLQGLSAQIKELTDRLAADPTDAEALAQLSALSDSISSNTGDLAAAVTANTPQANPAAPVAPAPTSNATPDPSVTSAVGFQNTPAESGVTPNDSGNPQASIPVAAEPVPEPAPVAEPADPAPAPAPEPVEQPVTEPVDIAPVVEPGPEPVTGSDPSTAPQPDVVDTNSVTKAELDAAKE